MKWLQVRNPANNQVGTMSERAFERVFKDQGYELVSETPSPRPSGRDPAFRDQDQAGVEETGVLTVDDLDEDNGWYTLPNGERVRGREKAERELEALQAAEEQDESDDEE